jgi:hypothetical protein
MLVLVLTVRGSEAERPAKRPPAAEHRPAGFDSRRPLRARQEPARDAVVYWSS